MTRDIKLAGFKYTKLNVERFEDFKGELKVTPSINIKSIDKHKSEASKQDLLEIKFQFGIDYSALGAVNLEGQLFLLTDSKTFKEALDGWKSKKLDSEINLIILNVIMQKASLKALELEEELNLPPHIQLPKLQLEKKE